MEKYLKPSRTEKKLSLKSVQNLIPANAPCIFYGVKGGMITGSYATFGDFVHVVKTQADILNKTFDVTEAHGIDYKYFDFVVKVKHKTEGWVYGAFMVGIVRKSYDTPVKFVKPTKSNNAFVSMVKMRDISKVKERIMEYKRA